MKRWKRSYLGYAGWITSPLFLLYFCVIQYWFDLTEFWRFVLPLICVLIPLIFAFIWALRNEVKKYWIAQTVGFALIFIAVAFIWLCMWNPEWGNAGSLDIWLLIYKIYPFLILACFLYPVIDGRRRRKGK